ncbi:hypothetical protein SAMN04488523_1511 [Sulfitobacter brevis]|uniref:Uncharacterized protein n=1 Tax=Sulfitobacter brevis TaxID=74348 RepID=A0A1I2HGQ1_9RHOB|nr:hypothetical protein [Sulfitobacter brevis]SFF28593.1 hypothetical protein SAMN04488523_1511 [Sulfitobacter brevis]
MKRIFEKDSPHNVDVFECKAKIAVKFPMKPRVRFYGDAPHYFNSVGVALDREGIDTFLKHRSKPHRFFLLFALLAISAHVVFSLYLYPIMDWFLFFLYLVASAIPYLHVSENSHKIRNYLDELQGRRNRKIFEKYGTSEYQILVEFDKIAKTVHPSLDKELFSPEGYDMVRFRPIETEPTIDDCKPFPIDENSIFVYDATRTGGIEYRYGLRQSKFGFSLSSPTSGKSSYSHSQSETASLVAILNEIITLVRDGTIETEDQPFNPMD